MRTLVWTGSRGWQDADTIADCIDGLRQPFRSIVGGAKGFDTLVEQALEKRGLPYLRFDAKWRIDGHYDAGAGHKRSALMLRWVKRLDPDGFLMIGWDGKSPGTKKCMALASKMWIKQFRLQYIPKLNGE